MRHLILIIGLWSLIILGANLVELYPLSIFLVLPILGVLQHNLAYFAHDGAHFSIFPQSHNVNNFIAQWILFAPFLVDLKSYRKWHNKHHAYIGTEKDPEYELKMLAPKKYAPPAIN